MLCKLIRGDLPMPHFDWPALWANLTHLGMLDDPTHPVSLAEKIVRPVLVYLLLVFALRKVGQADAGPAQPVRLRRPAHAVEHGAERHHRQRHLAPRAA